MGLFDWDWARVKVGFSTLEAAVPTAAYGRTLEGEVASASTVLAQALGDSSLEFCWGDMPAVGIQFDGAGMRASCRHGRRSCGGVPQFLGVGTDAVVQPVGTSDKLRESFVFGGILEGEGAFQFLVEATFQGVPLGAFVVFHDSHQPLEVSVVTAELPVGLAEAFEL
jgi:hypothetical protein